MQKLSNIGIRNMRKNILVACITGILLSTSIASIAFGIEEVGERNSNYSLHPPSTYYNATLFIISNVYRKVDFEEGVIHLWDFRYPCLPGIWIIKDENGIQEFNLRGGWFGARVEIYGFDGFLKQRLYTVLIGNCTKISIISVR